MVLFLFLFLFYIYIKIYKFYLWLSGVFVSLILHEMWGKWGLRGEAWGAHNSQAWWSWELVEASGMHDRPLQQEREVACCINLEYGKAFYQRWFQTCCHLKSQFRGTDVRGFVFNEWRATIYMIYIYIYIFLRSPGQQCASYEFASIKGLHVWML